MTIEYQDLPADADKVVDQVFAGETVISRGFSDLLGAPTITVGTPIYRGGSIYGALLMHDAVSVIQDRDLAGRHRAALRGRRSRS